MNMADAQRDVNALPAGETTWGQYKTNGVFSYPADIFYGAYLLFVDISGGTTTTCEQSGTTSLVAQEVVQYAKAEWELWQSPDPTIVPVRILGNILAVRLARMSIGALSL